MSIRTSGITVSMPFAIALTVVTLSSLIMRTQADPLIAKVPEMDTG